ncbi:MAG: D-tagatose-bisphosphate aldolase, class II, non-catalytic subunit [Alkalimonas sp.]|nr:D-tagatose-bisphosphate aldolase, class II, non-catalytic subunit [Alkalimonas sp.]
MQQLRSRLAANKTGQQQGIYSVCSAHPLVIKAALRQARQDQSQLLIEATANQVNQFGGYTGMKPADFISFVADLAAEEGVDSEQLLFGGDHLGPVCWQQETAEQAMHKSEELIACYVAAGFSKIHLDTSMGCADDPDILPDEVIAKRAARLCWVAEQTAAEYGFAGQLCYVVGTEVPPPGGVSELETSLQVTSVDDVATTISVHREAFSQQGLSDEVWSRVIAVVVQPGVEFDNDMVHPFEPAKAEALSQYIQQEPGLVYEAHSTDYQSATAYQHLVRGHFAILKVGPQLTFALREALFALAHIEQQLVPAEQCSDLINACLQLMNKQPAYWQRFYQAQEQELRFLQLFSYSDRIRYYWPQPELQGAVRQLFSNLARVRIPQPVLHQYLPQQAWPEPGAEENCSAEDRVIQHIQCVLKRYAQACGTTALIKEDRL